MPQLRDRSHLSHAEKDAPLSTLRAQQNLGQVAGADIAAQEAVLAQAQQPLLPPLQKQLSQQRDALTALAGRFPSEEIAQNFDLASLQLPVDLAVSPAVGFGQTASRRAAGGRKTCTPPAPMSARLSRLGYRRLR